MHSRSPLPYILLVACVASLTSCSTTTSTLASTHRKVSVSDQFYPVRPDGTKNEGVAELNVCVAANSTLESANIVKSSGYQDLDDAAVAVMQSGRYKAGTQDGRPVRMCKKYRVTFDPKKGKQTDGHNVHEVRDAAT